ncbi:cell wall hydrolase [Mizugakiibacter sediminis]|uniref:Cell wall hydrolase n=1 Tax=Mizugakiibacter sediminis TaxID=1475481 RepID=A0A0K8QRN1_9GAMM|nr:cell wall hydrolase [Mizugakiibacter sediminis]GAP67316.1 cell wall hydrolase [Mizugakiibacter sediminis]
MKLSWLLWLASVLPQPLADQTCLATTVYLEARSEPALGQLAVAEVALRRRDRGRWGDNVCAVVSAPRQFAVTTTPKSFEIANVPAWNKAWRIAGEALTMWQQPRGKRVVVVPMADHFVKLDEAQPEWAKGAPLARIGEHSFFAVN